MAFDDGAAGYNKQLERGLAVTGEGRDYFANGRIRHLASRLARLSTTPGRVLDYGCGDGDSMPRLRSLLGASEIVGVDSNSHQVTRGRITERVLKLEEVQSEAAFDLVYCNGVLHHVEPDKRQGVLSRIHGCLSPEGLFALFENNPLNPGTRLVMRRIPFDRDARPLTHWEATRRLKAAGFAVIRVDFLFFFPGWLSCFRRLEPHLTRVAIGGQYLVLARRSASVLGCKASDAGDRGFFARAHLL